MDCYLEWNADFVIGADGDLLLVDGDVEVRQRLERRLFTAVQGYVWHPEYGAGLPQKIGSVYSPAQIQAIVLSQLQKEASLAAYPPTNLNIIQSPNEPDNIGIGIQYYDALTGVSVSFQITT